ncbi:MAG: hypothetical protein C4337_09240 [Armatimonadota bacterium]
MVIRLDVQNGNQANAPRKEPVFEDKPIEESSWGGLVSLLKQVNRLKAELLVSLYGETRVAYRKYHERRDEAIARYTQQRQQRQVDAAYNQWLEAEIEPLRQELRELMQRQLDEMDALRREWETAYLQARIEAGRYGLNLRGDPLFGFEEDNPTPPPPNSLEPQPSRGNLLTRWLANRATRSDASPPNDTQNQSVDREALRQEIRQVLREELGTDPKVRQHAQARTPEFLPPLSESEVVAKDHLPTVNPPILPLWLWWVLVVLTGGFVGLLSLIALGVDPSDWRSPILWLAVGAGAATSLLFVSALWGAAAVVGELYHLFSWEEHKSTKASKLIGGLWLLFLVLMFGMLISLALTVWVASTVSPVRGAVLTFVGLMVLSMVSVAMVKGFLYGRRKWTKHRIAAQLIAAERERCQHPRMVPDEVRALVTEARARRQVWTERQNFFEQRKQELQEQIDRLEQQKRPIYDEMPPEEASALQRMVGVWAQRYTYFLEALADALKECKDGDSLAEEVQRHKQEIIRTYLL